MPAQRVKVIGISDGDSFTVLFPDNTTQRIRLHGIDCPENEQPFSAKAKQFTASLLYKKEVTIKQTDRDRYNRIVAIVILNDSTILNERLLSAGFAWHYTWYDKNPEWDKLEQQARKKSRGLWSDKNSIEPWEWRRVKKTSNNCTSVF